MPKNLADWKSIKDEKEKYNAYLCSREWAEKRKQVLLRAKNLCQHCRRRRATVVHHLTYARKYNELIDDLAALCRNCHDTHHGKAEPLLAPRSRLENLKCPNCGSGLHFHNLINRSDDDVVDIIIEFNCESGCFVSYEIGQILDDAFDAVSGWILLGCQKWTERQDEIWGDA